MPEVRSFDDYDVRNEALGHDYYNTHFDDLEVSSDRSSPFTSPLKPSTSLDTFEDVLIIPDPSLPLALLGEIEEEYGFEIDASFVDQCGTLVESEDVFSEEHSLNKPYVVDFSEVTPPDEPSDLVFDECTPDLAPIPPISPLSSPLPLFFLF